jgi:hypothetical protein
MIILNFFYLRKELRVIITNVTQCNLSSGKLRSTVRGNVGLYEATESSSMVYNLLKALHILKLKREIRDFII